MLLVAMPGAPSSVLFQAIYAADQFESFSNPYTEVLHEQIASSLHLYSTIRPSAVAAFFVLSASISARIARLPLFVDMSRA